MNYIKPEDIKEYVSKNPEGIAGMSEELTAMVNHFAELIVRECMGVARGMRNPPNLNYKPSDRFVDELRLHFGVKE